MKCECCQTDQARLTIDLHFLEKETRFQKERLSDLKHMRYTIKILCYFIWGRVGWAAVYGIPQSRTLLKWLSSSSSYIAGPCCLSILYVIVYIYPTLPVHPSPNLPPAWQLQVCSLSLFCFIQRFICILLILHVSAIMWYLSFSFWLRSHSMIICSCIYVAATDIISLFLMAE